MFFEKEKTPVAFLQSIDEAGYFHIIRPRV